MPSAAKKLAIVHNDEPAPTPIDAQGESFAESIAESEAGSVGESVGETPSDAVAQEPQARPEALRLLEAMLFAAAEPLDEATLARPLQDGADIKQALAMLQAEYATRGVNLVRVGKKWTFRTAADLSWLLTKQTVESKRWPSSPIISR
jgi:segregation and condensation protein B